MRVPLYLRATARPLFAWYHGPEATPRNEAVVICQPLGHEYINAHRAMRHLAERLAAVGVPSIRFDYDGTGDSAGQDADADRVGAWLESIRQAAQALRARSGCARVSFVGLRMGATLAALVSREFDVASLVLWAPCVRGRTYLRELKALAASGNGSSPSAAGAAIEAGGFVIGEATQAAITAINLEEIRPRADRVFIAARADLPDDPRLALIDERWSAAGLEVTRRRLPGYADMLATPHNTQVPEEALAAIVEWIAPRAHMTILPRAADSDQAPAAWPRTCVMADVRESMIEFGAHEGTFGVLSEPVRGAAPTAPVVIISNAGATHHVGPGRLYVDVARALSRRGLRCLRLDLPGLGDSRANGGRENDPYPPGASAVIGSAIDVLRRQHAATACVVLGLCSGAHTAFHAALDLADLPVAEVVLINPLTFKYRPGMPLDPLSPLSPQGAPAQRCLEGIRQVSHRSGMLRAITDAATTVAHAGRRVRKRGWPKGGTSRLERELLSLADRGRRVTLLFSRFDPGYNLLLAEAGGTVKRLARRGDISLFTIKHANHTFDGPESRGELIRSISAHLAERHVPRPAPAAGRIRLSTFVAQFGCGGTERQFLNLSLALDAGRFDLEYGCMNRWGPLMAELQGRNIPVHEYSIRNLYGVAARYQQWRLARHFQREAIQVLHAYNFYSNAFAIPAAWLAGVPVIIASIRDRGVYLTTAQRHLQRYVCTLADCVLVNADAIRDWLVSDGYDPGKIVVIRNGIDLPRFDVPRTAGLRREFGVAERAPIVAMFARLNPKKGIEDFIEAAALVRQTHPEVRFLVVGESQVSNHGTFHEDTAYRQSIDDRIARHGLQSTVLLTGYRSDVPELLAETTVSVLPSHSEGLSNTLLESMASGVPVVATRVGGTPEVVEDGVTGLLVPPADARTLAGAIARVLSDEQLAARLGEAGRRSVRMRFGIDKMVHATEQLYLDLLARRAAEPRSRRRRGLSRLHDLDALASRRTQ